MIASNCLKLLQKRSLFICTDETAAVTDRGRTTELSSSCLRQKDKYTNEGRTDCVTNK